MLEAAGHAVTRADLPGLDILDPAQCVEQVAGHDVVVNCAAYTAVDAAETDEAARLRGQRRRRRQPGPRGPRRRRRDGAAVHRLRRRRRRARAVRRRRAGRAAPRPTAAPRRPASGRCAPSARAAGSCARPGSTAPRARTSRRRCSASRASASASRSSPTRSASRPGPSTSPRASCASSTRGAPFGIWHAHRRGGVLVVRPGPGRVRGARARPRAGRADHDRRLPAAGAAAGLQRAVARHVGRGGHRPAAALARRAAPRRAVGPRRQLTGPRRRRLGRVPKSPRYGRGHGCRAATTPPRDVSWAGESGERVRTAQRRRRPPSEHEALVRKSAVAEVRSPRAGARPATSARSTAAARPLAVGIAEQLGRSSIPRRRDPEAPRRRPSAPSRSTARASAARTSTVALPAGTTRVAGRAAPSDRCDRATYERRPTSTARPSHLTDAYTAAYLTEASTPARVVVVRVRTTRRLVEVTLPTARRTTRWLQARLRRVEILDCVRSGLRLRRLRLHRTTATRGPPRSTTRPGVLTAALDILTQARTPGPARGRAVGSGPCSPSPASASPPPTRSPGSRSGSAPTRRCPTAGRPCGCAPPRSTTTTSARCAASACPPTGCRWCSAATAPGSTPTATRCSCTPWSPRRGGPATRRSTRAAACSARCTTAPWPRSSPCPRHNLVPKPEGLSWEHAACLPTAWLTAYRMLFTNSGVQPGGTVLVQGAGGGVATALVQLGTAAGIRMWVTSRDAAKGEHAVALGADRAFESGARLPERVDAVMETVGAATWSHSVNSLRPGGTVVISGRDLGRRPGQGRADQDLLQAAAGRRVDDGHPRRAGAAGPLRRRRRHRAAGRLGAAARRRPGRASSGWCRARSRARSSSRSEPGRPPCGTGPRRGRPVHATGR